MKVELFLDEGEEYPQLFSVWRVDQKTGRADLTTRRNYVDDKKRWDKWRETDDENIRLKAENAKLRDLCADLYAEMLTYSNAPTYNASVWSTKLRELGIEVGE